MGLGVKIVGVGHGLPKECVDNTRFEQIVETSDEWIKQRTGVEQRRILSGDETVTQLAAQACREALENADIGVGEVGLIIGSTITSDTLTPSLASNVQKSLGLERAAAFDVSAGCTGFIYSLTIAKSLMQSLQIKTALVVAGEGLSRYVDWQERSTCVLFGDGAGAVVLQACEQDALLYPYLQAKPDSLDVLYVKNKCLESPFFENDAVVDAMKLRMDGREVFAFANEAIIETLGILAKQCGDKPFSKIFLHQANYRMPEYVARKTEYSIDQFFINVSQYANTSSASLPIALWDAKKQGWLVPGDRIALIGFGAGLSWGGMIVDWTAK